LFLGSAEILRPLAEVFTAGHQEERCRPFLGGLEEGSLCLQVHREDAVP
jgi:hypothetical protein